MSRHVNGEGSIYRRKDGRWTGSYFAETTSGERRRVYVYGRTRTEVSSRLREHLHRAQRGIRVPTKRWRVDEYLDYWLSSVAAHNVRPKTLETYRQLVRNHLRPMIGRIRLDELSVSTLQGVLNERRAAGVGVSTIHHVRAVLRNALSRAQREELIERNVAQLVDLPTLRPRARRPWSVEQAKQFLDYTRSDPWRAAFVLLLTYGMRRGEVLGLQWEDVDFDAGTIHVRHQLQRIEGALQLGPVKTRAGDRLLPLTPVVATALLSTATYEGAGFVFRSAVGTPIDPKNFVRRFRALQAAAGLPSITVHDLRHTNATLLKALNVPVVDAAAILGHAQVSTTQQLYQHGDISAQTAAITKLGESLYERVAVKSAVKRTYFRGQHTNFMWLTSGGPGGTRTLDTLLKRIAQAPLSPTLTSVSDQLQTSTYACELGHVAVRSAISRRWCARTCETDSRAIMASLRRYDPVA